MVKFIKYPDIENSYRQEFVDKIKEMGYGNIEYVVTEKIHGANSQIAYDVNTGEFFYGKRSGFLEEGEQFYNLRAAIKRYERYIVDMAQQLKHDLGRIGQRMESMTIFGEICGGSYPHPDVVKDNHASKVQKGVFYSPRNVWLAFDIAYTIADVERPFFLSYSKFNLYCMMYDIPTVPEITRAASLDEALTIANDQESHVYKFYDLPKLDNNIMEGVVIRPYNIDTWFGMSRLVLKNKNEHFKEKAAAKEDIPKEIPEQVKAACEELSQYINVNRVHNVISHIGEVTPKDIGRIIKEMSQDVLADYRKEHDTLDKLEKQDEKMVTKFLGNEVAKVVRDVVILGK